MYLDRPNPRKPSDLVRMNIKNHARSLKEKNDVPALKSFLSQLSKLFDDKSGAPAGYYLGIVEQIAGIAKPPQMLGSQMKLIKNSIQSISKAFFTVLL